MKLIIHFKKYRSEQKLCTTNDLFLVNADIYRNFMFDLICEFVLFGKRHCSATKTKSALPQKISSLVVLTVLTVDTEPAVLSRLMQKEERLEVWDRRSAGCDPSDPAPSVSSASRSPIALNTLYLTYFC